MVIAALPTELFGLISSHVQDHATLLALLRTSHAFNHDAENILYRDVDLTCSGWRQHLLVSHLASCKRVAAFVQSIAFTPYLFSKEQIRNVLRATVNLTSLSIQYNIPCQPDYRLSDLTNGTSFKLKSLDINCYQQQDLNGFIHSQRQISSFTWLPHILHNSPANFPAPSDLSNITTLYSTPEFLKYILPHCQLRRLRLGHYFALPIIPSLEVFLSSHPEGYQYRYPNRSSQLDIVFPNLRYFEVYLRSEDLIQKYLDLPPRIEVLKIMICPNFIVRELNNQTMFDHAQRLFESFPNLRYVEMGHIGNSRKEDGVKVRLLGEGTEKRYETSRLDAWDYMEWIRW